MVIAIDSSPNPGEIKAVEGVDRGPAGSLTIAELSSLSAASAVGLVALTSLIAGHLAVHDPPLVFVVSAILMGGTSYAIRRWARVPIASDCRSLAPMLFGIAIAAVTLFPGFEYGTGGRDPGVYVEHAIAIQRTDGVTFDDDLVEVGLAGGILPQHQSWPGLLGEPGNKGSIYPQFYHLWPALLATAKDVGGFTCLFNTGPLLGLIAVGLCVCVANRVGGLAAAWAAAVILPTNMLQVWQSKYPTAEVFGQMLFLACVLAVIVSIRTGSRAAAAAAGMFLSLTYLERADAILLVLMAWAGVCALIAVGKFDARAGHFVAGAGILLPYAWYQAYDLANYYTRANQVPELSKIVLVMAVLGSIATVLNRRRRLGDSMLAWVKPDVRRVWLGLAFVGVCGLLMLLGALRSRLFGESYGIVGYGNIRSYDEMSLIRLTWFFSVPGMALLLGGVAYVAMRRWRADAWLIMLPTVVLLALYCYRLQNSPYLMWATRRFVTNVVPGMVILIGCGIALAFLLVRRHSTQIAAVATAALLIVGLGIFGLTQSWPLRSHNEDGGSIQVVRQLTRLAGEEKGVYLFQWTTTCCAASLFGGPMFATAGQSSAAVPANSGAAIKTYVDFFASTPRPVFLVVDNVAKETVPAVPGVAATKVLELDGALPRWEQTYVTRPKKSIDYPYRITVYRLAKA